MERVKRKSWKVYILIVGGPPSRSAERLGKALPLSTMIGLRIGVGQVNHSEIVSFLWGVADLIRDTFKRGKYQDVILPLTVLRRLDCVLAPTKAKVLKRQAELRGKGLKDLDAQLRRVARLVFYNTSRYDFDKLLADAPYLAANLRNYSAGFSANMREVLEKFHFDNTISTLDEAGLLFQVLERFKNVDLHPDKVDNPTNRQRGGCALLFEKRLALLDPQGSCAAKQAPVP